MRFKIFTAITILIISACTEKKEEYKSPPTTKNKEVKKGNISIPKESNTKIRFNNTYYNLNLSHHLDSNNNLFVIAALNRKKDQKEIYTKIITPDSLYNIAYRNRKYFAIDSIRSPNGLKFIEVIATKGIRGYNNYFQSKILNGKDTIHCNFQIKAFKNKLWVSNWGGSKHAMNQLKAQKNSLIYNHQKNGFSIDSVQLGYHKLYLFQKKDSLNYGLCDAKAYVFSLDMFVDSLEYKEIDAVGGSYGFSEPIKVKNHLIFTKHGDYNGITCVVNKFGVIKEVIGGENYITKNSDLLVTKFDSDISGIGVFDLKNDTIILEIDNLPVIPMDFYSFDNDRLLVHCIDRQSDDKSVWELELDLGRFTSTDLDSTNLKSSNKLSNVGNMNANCTCYYE